MRRLQLRAPVEGDWPALLDLANRSLAGVEGATGQDLWVANRRSFSERAGLQQHWVAEDPASGEILGYVAVERRSEREPGVRVFVVTEPTLRDDVGGRLLSHALDVARSESAANAWFIEYAADALFLSFLERQGFTEVRRFALPEGGEACVMNRVLGAEI